jgi:hypothetical protein
LLHKNKKRIYLFFLLTLMVGSFAWGKETVAVNIALSPPCLEFVVNPGDFFEAYLELSGAPNQDIRVKTYFQDWQYDREGGVIFLSGAGELLQSAAPWLQSEPAELIVPAGEKRMLRVYGTVPAGTGGGDYWTGFFVETLPVAPPQASGIVLAGRVGGGIFISVRGESKKKGMISRLEVTWEDGLSGRIVFVNEGSVRLQPAGRLEIKDAKGKTVEKVLLEETTVLPGSEREIYFQAEINLSPGHYVVLAILDYGGEKLVGAQAVIEVNEQEN